MLERSWLTKSMVVVKDVWDGKEHTNSVDALCKQVLQGSRLSRASVLPQPLDLLLTQRRTHYFTLILRESGMLRIMPVLVKFTVHRRRSFPS